MKGISMERLFRKPWLIVGIIAAITVFFALQIPQARLDNNNFRFLPEGDAELMAMRNVNETFGSQIVILVGLERRHGTVLDPAFIEKLRSFEDSLGAISIVGSTASLVSTPYLTGVGDAIVSEPLVPDDFDGSKSQVADLREKILSWDMYRGSLVSEDFSATQVLVYLDIPPEDSGTPEVVAVHKAIKRLAGDARFPDTNIYITGLPVFSSVVNDAVEEDLVVLVPLVVVVVVGVLFLSFRRLSGVILPLLTVLVSAIWAIGAMPLFGVKLSMLSTILPVILVAVGSAYGIHVVSHYYDEMAEKRNIDGDEHRRILCAVLKRIGRPVLLAALTTFAGFVSFCFTKVRPIFEFGIFASFGVIAAYVVAVTLIPALLLIRGPVRKVPRFRIAEMEPGQEDPFSGAIADLLGHVSRKKRTVIFISVIILITSAVGLSRLVIDNVLVEYFQPDTDVVRSDHFIREKFGGSKSVNVVVTSENPGGVLHPEVLAAMDGLSAHLRAHVPEVGKTTGFTDLVKRINQVFNADENPLGLAAAGPAAVAGPGDGTAGADAAEPSFGFGFGSETTGESEAAPAFGFGSSPESSGSGEKDTAGSVPAAVQGTGAALDSDGSLDGLDSQALAALLARAFAEGGNSAMSAAELVEQMAKLTNYRGAAYYEIPTDPARYGKSNAEELQGLISNYLVLLSGDIGAFADDPLEPKSVRMQVQLKTIGQIDTGRAIKEIRSYVDEKFPKNVTVKIAGDALVEGSLNRLVVESQIVSIALSLLIVFLILAVYYRSVMAGLIGLAPLSISIMTNFAVMGFAGIKLNIGTAMVASTAIGIGIDYTIHYMAAFHHEYLLTGGTGEFLRRTFLTSGKAILFNAASVGAGFAVLCLSQFTMLAELGFLIALTMGTSALASLTILPVLLNILNPKFITRPLPSDRA
jgi:predicted RND superfamily exporter protein